MSAGIDHVATAKIWIENAVKAQASADPEAVQLAAAYAGIGRVHAVLALVEQQRIANLIAVLEATGRAKPSPSVVAGALAAVAEGLGL